MFMRGFPVRLVDAKRPTLNMSNNIPCSGVLNYINMQNQQAELQLHPCSPSAGATGLADLL